MLIENYPWDPAESITLKAVLLLALMLICLFATAQKQSPIEVSGPNNTAAALSSVLKELDTAGWGLQNYSSAAPILTPTSYSQREESDENRAPISLDRISKLIQKGLSGTAQGPINTRMTKFVGLTRDDEQLIVKQLKIDGDSVTHYFSVPIDDRIDRLVLILKEENRYRLFVIDRSGHLIADSGVSLRRGDEPKHMSDDETKEFYRSEMTLWADPANTIK